MEEISLTRAISALAPMVEEHASEAERTRKPVDAVMKAIEETQAYRWFVPRKYGGFEFSLEGFIEVGLTLGAADISTAWAVTFCMEHNWLMGLFNADGQEAIFRKHPYIIAPGTLSPGGTARPVDGGYIVNGRWQWGTGVMHADHVMVGALTDHEGEPEFCMYVLPIEDAEVLDTWQMSGMVGTGSNDIAVTDKFVPAHLRQNIADMRAGDSAGAKLHKTANFRMPMLPVLGLTAASPAVGCAGRTLEHFKERMKGRMVYGTADRQSERALGQSRLAHLTARQQTLENSLRETAREVSAWGKSGDICPDIERAALRVRLGHIVREARNIIRDIIEACGASAHQLDNPIQRAQRDVETLSGHTVFDLDVSSEAYGRLLLGLPSNTPL